MSKSVIQELLELQKRGIEPFMTEQGWTEFWRLALEEEMVVDDIISVENAG